MTETPSALRGRSAVLVLAALLCSLGLAPEASAAGSGFFRSTGSMTVPRSAAAAAALPDGRVLVAGGCCNSQLDPLSSAEIFNPATGTFTPTGSMSVPRSGEAAAPLPDGRVLVVGGCCSSTYPYSLSSAEVFDPATNSFSSAGVGSMTIPRSGAAAAPLPDGRVLVVGGGSSSAEVFDPATNSFSSAGIGSLGASLNAPAAAPLPDGRVLVAGGLVAEGRFLFANSGAEVFDPTNGTFSPTGAMSVPRGPAAAAPLPDGALVVGSGFSGVLSSAEAFDSATNTFGSVGIGSMTVARRSAAAAPLPRGRVLVAGGSDDDAPALSSAEIFAPVTCKGKQATIVASNGVDRGFRGTPAANVIVGLGGSDELFGLGGDDVICGGTGKDTLFGQNGDDRLSGQAGNDTLAGDAGTDVLKGGPGKDILIGGPGDDILKGGPGKDILKGGPGKDKQVQ
jgi:Ca2+-binding RTX toxin-like protein